MDNDRLAYNVHKYSYIPSSYAQQLSARVEANNSSFSFIDFEHLSWLGSHSIFSNLKVFSYVQIAYLIATELSVSSMLEDVDGLLKRSDRFITESFEDIVIDGSLSVTRVLISRWFYKSKNKKN